MIIPQVKLTSKSYSELLHCSAELGKSIREMEENAKILEIDISDDKLYISMRAYKKALDHLIKGGFSLS